MEKVDNAQDTYIAHNTLIYVLPYLNIPDLLRLSQVCKLWNEIVSNNSIWKNLTLKKVKFEFNNMLNFVNQKRTLRLTLVDCDYIQKDMNNFPEVATLKELEVSEFNTFINYKIKENRRDLDLAFLKGMGNLTKLVLNTQKKLVSAESLTHLTELNHLTILSYEIVRSLSLQNKLNFNNLEYLELFNIDNNDLDTVIKKIPKLKTLRIGNPFNVFCNSEIYWEKLQVIKEMPYFKELELINFEIEYKDLATCQNLEKLLFLPHCTMNICRNVRELGDSQLKRFVLAISNEHFRRLISETVHSFQRERSFYPPWEDIPFKPDMLNKLLQVNFGDEKFAEFPLLVNAIIEDKYETFLSTLQDILQQILPHINVSVVKFDDKWSEHGRIQWSSEYS